MGDLRLPPLLRLDEGVGGYRLPNRYYLLIHSGRREDDGIPGQAG